MLIIPALLESNINDLSNQIKRLSPYFSRFQIDIADGVYVPNKTVALNKVVETLQQFNNSTMKHCIFDFHLMVKDYDTDLQLLQAHKENINIGYVLIHFSLSPNCLLLSTKYSFPIGLVINLEDQITNLAVNYSLSAIPAIQIMSVPIGFQGSVFVPKALNKIEQLRNASYRNKILLDGGINKTTIPSILQQKYHPDILCIGSYLTKSKSVLKSKEEIEKIFRHF